jgi:aspartate dehydrogenase
MRAVPRGLAANFSSARKHVEPAAPGIGYSLYIARGADVLRVGIAGFGNVGRKVARALISGKIKGVQLAAVAARDLDKARTAAAAISPELRVVPLSELPATCDVVAECATSASFPEIARTVLTAGKDLICISVGGFLAIPELAEVAEKHSARVQIASGAMPGLDILRAAAEGSIVKVHLKTRIPPKSLANEAYVLEQGFDFRQTPPPEAVKVFEGIAREAARHFPRHLNAAVSVSLAGVGLDRTHIELWLDPTITGAIHCLEIESEEVGLTLISRNIPSIENAKTSRIVAPSVLAALRARVASIRAGS